MRTIFSASKGALGSNDKDQYVLKPDATSGASKLGSTTAFNPYRTDVLGKTLLPTGLRDLFLFSVADYNTLKGDNVVVTKDDSGVITIQFCHRGTAYKLVTDSNGRLIFPSNNYWMRVIGTTANVIHSDFSSDGKLLALTGRKYGIRPSQKARLWAM